MPAPIDFYFDFASPYGYLAATQIEGLAERHDRAVVWRPMMLGAAMKITGGQPLLHVPMREAYARTDMPRFARYLGVPFTLPEVTPILSLAAARAYYWVEETDAALAKRLARALFDEHFGAGRDIAAPELVAAIAGAIGIDGEALLAAIQTEPVKARLKAETQAAVDRGVFGSPFFFVDDEPFWGVDRLPHVERWLETGGF